MGLRATPRHDAVAGVPPGRVYDGEPIAFASDGLPSFPRVPGVYESGAVLTAGSSARSAPHRRLIWRKPEPSGLVAERTRAAATLGAAASASIPSWDTPLRGREPTSGHRLGGRVPL